MSLAQEADARKLRLLALRKRREDRNGGTPESNESRQSEGSREGRQVQASGTEPPVLSLRNFDPETRTLRKRGGEDDDMNGGTVEMDVAGLAEAIIAEEEETRAQELDLTNIAPKRPNWDLKRELDKKLAKLERKTQEAVQILIRQRLVAQKGETEDIIGAMQAQETLEANSDEESDED